ncbi:hypothetical protein ABZ820_24135 [Streptomyces diacarni]|uniref:hypothetical protein n=1 Tax=Streptomyces diacarni TaxID=2800381 RepID=UPI0033CEA3FE
MVHIAENGQEGATTADAHFDGVRAGYEALVSGVMESEFRESMSVPARGRVRVSALATGLAQRALDESAAHSADNR